VSEENTIVSTNTGLLWSLLSGINRMGGGISSKHRSQNKKPCKSPLFLTNIYLKTKGSVRSPVFVGNVLFSTIDSARSPVFVGNVLFSTIDSARSPVFVANVFILHNRLR
jgi:hypothetical protein